MITSLGDSGLPVFQAGHCDWHRPHSVQVAMSSMPFQVKSSILPRPKMSTSGSASSKSSTVPPERIRSEEHTSELQSRRDLVCRLLLEKKKKQKKNTN